MTQLERVSDTSPLTPDPSSASAPMRKSVRVPTKPPEAFRRESECVGRDPVKRRTLAAIVAHPDDEAYGIAGVVVWHADDPWFRFVLVHATDGELGSIAEGSGATRGTLGAVRRAEDRRAWEALGRPPARHEWFGYPDWWVSGCSVRRARWAHRGSLRG